MKLYIAAILLALITGVPNIASAESGHHIVKENYSIRNGMVSNEVNCICQDNDGFIWAATGSGLSRFDGYDFLNIRSNHDQPDRLQSNTVNMIAANGNTLCIVSASGIDLMSLDNMEISHVSDSTIRNAGIRTVSFLDDDMLILAGKGIYTYSISRKEATKLSSMSVRTLFRDSSGNIWIGTWESGIYCIAAGTTSPSKFYLEGLPEKLSVNAFTEDKAGNLCVATWGNGLYIIRNLDLMPSISYHIFTPMNNSRQLDWNIVYCVSADDEGRIWAGSPGGLRLIEKDGTTTYPDSRLKEVKAIFCDRDDNIWISDSGHGMICSSHIQSTFKEVSPSAHGLDFKGITSAYAAPDGIYWLGVLGLGVVRYDSNEDRILSDDYFTKSINIPSTNAVMSFAYNPRTSGLLMATRYNGVYEATLNGRKITALKHYNTSDIKGVDNHTDIIEKSPDNRFWVGTGSGFAIISENGLEEPESVNKAIGYAHISAVSFLDDGGLVLGTVGKGLFVYREAYTKNYSKESGAMSTNNITSIYKDSHGIVLVGTPAGLYRFNPTTDELTLDPSTLQLMSDDIRAMVKDADGKLWLSTGKGLACIKLEDGTVINSGLSSAMDNLSFFKGSSCANGNEIAFGGYDGLTMFNSEDALLIGNARKPVITKIAQNGKVIAESPHASEVVTHKKDGVLSISFASPSFSNANQIRYSYRLSRYDNDWHYTSSAGRTVNYLNLKAGKYKFEYRACENYGAWTEPSILYIKVQSSPFVRWWAILIYLCIIAGIAYTIFFLHGKVQASKKSIEEQTAEIEHLKRKTINLDSYSNVKTVLDREFLEKIVTMVEDHLSDPEFNIESLYTGFDMSPSSVYRKVKLLTGLSPKDFVRDIRFRYACRLLEEKTANVADVAYAVGFSDAKYFSVCFKKAMGMTPTQYISDRNSSTN